ncbi:MULTISPECIES: ParB/RepB/Spo0J family partition protein [Anaerococcus]|uniref:ParB/RepB/Spo0J family partition protein n=1 Tax=Anaerococcus nagyae TaxID=1755241 RepID=A0A3E2TLN0_9FIRM|nr:MULTISPECIES: ParB/RepB/Spo0J family partition protein [Anaerococcus]MBP2070071.1 ParB family chromosome partitioning protein [Anaerococcus nagyae]MDU1828023.1 ParB/RepB/Spo0J family partition protein [Anaerococcus sp.]MDU1864554.1 ParB/RepB/Spo0J family partition protein [Anaerococcus sp.]MDU2353060.1 ParB/RepB/Spo0J family partition protein [Anaerococcus sp.]RGB78233.1 ParB/RepB/Spo0J family partition protein [Anaerococcus nagyae]
MANKKTLGRGLHSLIPEVNEDSSVDDLNSSDYKLKTSIAQYNNIEESRFNDKIVKISINNIKPRIDQPRKSFDDETIIDLSHSIKEYGLLNPIVVSKVNDNYEIIAGERRYRASKKAGLKEIDAIVRDYSKKEVEILSLIENVQREDLKVLEEASAYKKLASQYSMTQEQIANTMGKSRSYIANTMRLLNLNDFEKKALNDNKISSSQARTLLSIKDDNERKNTLDDFIKGKTNIRKVEKTNTRKKSSKLKSTSKTYGPNIDAILVEDLEEKFMDKLSTKVSINKSNKIYKVSIDCFTIEDIEQLYEKLANED